MKKPAYEHHAEVDGSTHASDQLVPVILKLLHENLKPPSPIKSVIDVGGGVGAWAMAFRRSGFERIKVVDSVSAIANAVVPDVDFEACDLAQQMPHVSGFDIAVCLECAEHLPSIRSSSLISFLTQSSPIVLFSAAVPGQPGLGHINCQPPEFWHELFAQHGYNCFDVVRPIILYESSIPTWYRQNIYLYLRAPICLSESIQHFPKEFVLIARSNYAQIENPSIRRIAGRLLPALLESARFHLRKLFQ